MDRMEPWTEFLKRYSSQVTGDSYAAQAYELYHYLRKASPRLFLKELIKSVLYTTRFSLSQSVVGLEQNLQFDLCFVIDSAGSPGLSTFFPILEAIPPDTRILVLSRDYVIRRSRLSEFGKTKQITIINLDRTHLHSHKHYSFTHAFLELVAAYPLAVFTAGQLVSRRLQYESTIRSILNHWKFRLLVVANERLMISGLSIHLAKEMHIATVCLQHGALVEQYLPVTADTYLTWGAHSVDWLSKRGVSAQLRPVGAPRVDRILEHVRMPGNHRDKKEREWVVFFSQPCGVDIPADCHLAVEREFLKLLDDQTVRLLVKVHPSDNRTRWEHLAKKHGNSLSLFPVGSDPYEAIRQANYVVSFY
ncbi:MAG: hypothetical protein MN733_00505, partial [Nitrososphaera sp.]|nr:hypothetical protein [Nitrososphaera sp.]